MKEIKMMEPVYIEKYGIKVNHYLTYAQIQQIVNSTFTLNSWSERQQNIDMLVLYHATDMTEDEVNNLSHELALESGLIETVMETVRNIDCIYEGIRYTESVSRSLAQIIREFPKYLKPLEEVMKKHGKSIQK